jgi:hypothetical protein
MGGRTSSSFTTGVQPRDPWLHIPPQQSLAAGAQSRTRWRQLHVKHIQSQVADRGRWIFAREMSPKHNRCGNAGTTRCDGLTHAH